MEIITCILSAPLLSDLKPSRNTSTTRFPFAYARLSPPAKESRGAEWVKSKQLVTLSESSHPTPAPPSSGLYAVGSTCLPTTPRSFPRIPPGPPPPHPARPPPFKEPLKVVQEPEAFWDFCPSVWRFLKS